jgi:hypothetical protein
MGGLGNRLFQFAFLYSQVREGKLPDIYLQDYRIFDKYKEELRGILRSDTDFVIQKVSLHIRRGDYVGNPFYIDLAQTDYYRKAVEQFPNEKFLVFCADRQEGNNDGADRKWCQEFLSKFLPNDRFKFYNSKEEVRDFNAMMSCKAHIIANSSFSFFAAYLSGNRTIAPSAWFADGTSIPLPSNFEIL